MSESVALSSSFSDEGSSPKGNFSHSKEVQKSIKNRIIRPRKLRSALFPYVLTSEQFLEKTSASERAELRSALATASVHFLKDDRSVYLEGLGIFFRVQSQRQNSALHSGKLASRHERFKEIRFEKTSELTQFHHERFPRLVETKELAARVYLVLPTSFQVLRKREECACLVRSLVRAIRDEIIVDGFSEQTRSPWQASCPP